jgi:hypothetical protein
MQYAFEQHFLSTYGHGSWCTARTKPEASVPNWRPEMAYTTEVFRPVLKRLPLWRRIWARFMRQTDSL